MPDDVRIPVTLEVDPGTAAALQDPTTRARAIYLLSRLVQPEGAEQSIEAHRHDDDTVAAARMADVGTAEMGDLVARFRAFADRHTLGGLDIKELIAEGRR